VCRCVGLAEVELRGEGRAERAEDMHGGERTDGECSETGLSHCSKHQENRRFGLYSLLIRSASRIHR
jgi:hypothetical protein